MRIVVVEDHNLFRTGMVMYVRDVLSHIIVAEFSNGKTFIDNIRQYAYDIILMDINMPEMNGLEATKKYDWFYNTCQNKIIAITMDTEISMKTLIEHGFKGCVFKDEVSTLLEPALNIVYNGQYYWSPRISI